MATDCEIYACGVLAVGRCSTCGQAMCESHRAVRLVSTPVVDVCARCRAARLRDHDDLDRNRQQRVGAGRDAIRRTARELVAAGHQPTEKYFHACGGLVTTLGNEWIPLGERWTLVDDPANHRYGWYVGEFKWYAISKAAYSTHIPDVLHAVPRRTFVTVDGDVVAEHTSEDRTPRVAGVDPTRRPDGLMMFLESVADRFEEVAQSLMTNNVRASATT